MTTFTNTPPNLHERTSTRPALTSGSSAAELTLSFSPQLPTSYSLTITTTTTTRHGAEDNDAPRLRASTDPFCEDHKNWRRTELVESADHQVVELINEMKSKVEADGGAEH